MELHGWLPLVIQRVDPFCSPVDVYKGQRWSLEIAKELEAADFGILCITRANLHRPWLVFEAGALSKKLDSGRVCPLLFDIDPADLDGPLSQFQVSRFDREEVFKLVVAMNLSLTDDSGRVPEQRLLRSFDKWWPDLSDRIQSHLLRLNEPAGNPLVPLRTDREILEEVVVTVRQIATSALTSAGGAETVLDASAITHVLVHLHKLVALLHSSNAMSVDSRKMLREIHAPLRFIVDRNTFSNSSQAECSQLLDSIQSDLGPTV